MIDQALKFLQTELNSYLNLKIDSGSIGQVFLRPLVKQDSSLAMENDSISLILVNIEEEHAMNQQSFLKKNGADIALINPAINLNLLILFAANFTNYDQALKFLSLTILFFQQRSHFSGEKSPELNINGVEEITIKLKTLSLEQQNHLWGTLGAKYMPSVMFKVSLLSFHEMETLAEVPQIQSIESTLNKLQ